MNSAAPTSTATRRSKFICDRGMGLPETAEALGPARAKKIGPDSIAASDGWS